MRTLSVPRYSLQFLREFYRVVKLLFHYNKLHVRMHKATIERSSQSLSLRQNSGILIRRKEWLLAKCTKQPRPRQRCISKTLSSLLPTTSNLCCMAEALFSAFIETNRMFPRLPFVFVAYASTLSLANCVETAVYTFYCNVLTYAPPGNHLLFCVASVVK